MRKRTIQLAAVAALMGAAIAYAADLRPRAGGEPDRSRAREHRAAEVKVRGHVEGLYPGARRPILVSVRNRRPRPVRLRQLRTRVLGAGPGCPRRHLMVRRFKRPLRLIPAHGRIRAQVRVQVRPSAPDSCQGARWPLRFRARVREAS